MTSKEYKKMIAARRAYEMARKNYNLARNELYITETAYREAKAEWGNSIKENRP